MKFRSTDVVIHIRDPLVDQKKPQQAGFALDVDYFISILSEMKYTRIFVIAQTNMYHHKTVLDLERKLKAQLYQVASQPVCTCMPSLLDVP